jgi:hypothetical protein
VTYRHYVSRNLKLNTWFSSNYFNIILPSTPSFSVSLLTWIYLKLSVRNSFSNLPMTSPPLCSRDEWCYYIKALQHFMYRDKLLPCSVIYWRDTMVINLIHWDVFILAWRSCSLRWSTPWRQQMFGCSMDNDECSMEDDDMRNTNQQQETKCCYH